MRTNLSNLIATRILRDGHVTLTQLEHRAAERGVLLSDLYAALDAVHRDKRITRGVRGGEVYYKPAAAPKTPYRPTLPPYPTSTYTESPFKVCSCALWHIHWHPSLGHFPQCDAITYTDEYAKQNPWDSTAGTMIDLAAYEKICNKEKAIRGRRTARHLPPS